MSIRTKLLFLLDEHTGELFGYLPNVAFNGDVNTRSGYSISKGMFPCPNFKVNKKNEAIEEQYHDLYEHMSHKFTWRFDVLNEEQPKKTIYSMIKCCDAIEDIDNMMHVSVNPPFSDEVTEPKAYLLDDGGHGGNFEMKFCPFCGKQITIKIIN